MFGKKYIFETKETRFVRYLMNLVIIFLAVIFSYTLFCFVFVIISKNENKITSDAFFKKNPDLIVVFTGDKGRIPFALKKAKELEQPHIFITGVYSKNTVNSLLKTTPDESYEKTESDFLKIDYLARNTVENVLSTLRYLRNNPSLKKILVISHDYHIMRIKIIMNKIKNPDDDFEFYYLGIDTDYSNFRNIRLLYKEVFKLFRTYGFLLFWDTDINKS